MTPADRKTTILVCHPLRIDFHHDTTFFGLAFSKPEAIAAAKRRADVYFDRVKTLVHRLEGAPAWVKYEVVGSLMMAEGTRGLAEVEVAALELLGRNPHAYGRTSPILDVPIYRPISDARVDRYGLGILKRESKNPAEPDGKAFKPGRLPRRSARV